MRARLANHALNHRTVAEIQRNIIKKGERGFLSKIFHAKNDKEVIAAWRVELNMVLHVFNVRWVGCFRQSLTTPPSD